MFADPHAFFQTLFVLWFGHFLGDFSLQNDFVAKAKNPIETPDPNIWITVMLAHCMIHAGVVFVITGVLWHALFVLFTHIAIDIAKCVGYLGKGSKSFVFDQCLHFLVLLLITIAICFL
jgi:type IV secretory pathway VirB6-like protein